MALLLLLGRLVPLQVGGGEGGGPGGCQEEEEEDEDGEAAKHRVGQNVPACRVQQAPADASWTGSVMSYAVKIRPKFSLSLLPLEKGGGGEGSWLFGAPVMTEWGSRDYTLENISHLDSISRFWSFSRMNLSCGGD